MPIKDWLREEKYYKVVRQLFEQDFVAEFFDQEKLLKMLDDNFADKMMHVVNSGQFIHS